MEVEASQTWEQLCEICGNIGVEEAIVTCCQCKSSSEHMYCMKTFLKKHFDDWLCEDCKSCSKMPQASSSLHGEFPREPKLSDSVEKYNLAVQHEESRKLMNQSMKVPIDWEKRVATRKTKYICAEEAILLSSEATKDWFILKQDLDSGSSEKWKTQGLGNVEISERQQSKKITGGNCYTPMGFRTSTDENVKTNTLFDRDKHSFTPALGALWKGSFCIYHFKHGEFSLQIQAHPPCLVRRKAYIFSKQMPKILDFKMVSCKNFWIHFFQDYFRDTRDIGLYFFSSDKERSDDFVSLLESMNVKNLALRKQIGDVELLVFTSKLLPVDCQCWQGKYFLWGVFHRLKRDPTAGLDSGLMVSEQPLDDTKCDCKQGDDDEVVDMDIDMLGGAIVGKMDVPVPKGTLKEHARFRDDPRSVEQSSVSSHMGSVAGVPSLNAKMEIYHDIPPGFEEAFWLRVQGSVSLGEERIVGGRNDGQGS